MLRILLADQDDANAFLFQCGVNRLGRPCAFQRVTVRAQLLEKIRSFQPNIIIVAGDFAQPDEILGIKQHTNGHPVICAVSSIPEGEAALQAGASDCVFVSQVDELHVCIERHLTGENKTPYFRKGAGSVGSKAPAKTPSKLDLKLEKFDRWVGAHLKRLAVAARIKGRKLARVSHIACVTANRELCRRYKMLKVQWLLHKQKRLVEANLPARSAEQALGRDDAAAQAAPAIDRESFPHLTAASQSRPPGFNDIDSPKMIRIVSGPSTAKEPAFNSENRNVEPTDSETLRTLELSFKTLFHTALDPMFLLDGLGSFLLANAPACALLGVAPADLLGKSLLDFVSATDRAQVSAMWEALLIEGQQKAETHLQTAKGESRDVLLSARSNLWFGVHLLIVRDQTELKALRETLRDRQQLAS